jgi:hypothetical protein
MALGPGVPDPPSKSAVFQIQQSRHRIADGFVMLAQSALGGLHHEYSLVPAVPDRVFAEHRSLGGDAAVISSLQGGTLDMTMVSTGLLAGMVKEFVIFDLPFLFNEYR